MYNIVINIVHKQKGGIKMAESIAGKRFGRLIAIRFVEYETKIFPCRKIIHHIWECVCDCGKIVNKRRNSLLSGQVNSCGCLLIEFYEEMKHKNIQTNILPPGEAALNLYYGSYKRSAKLRQIGFYITKEQFHNMIIKDCHYCKLKPKRTFPSKKNLKRLCNGSIVVNGVDRVDYNKDYTTDNCVPCCKFCNLAKGQSSLEEFLEWLNYLRNPGDKNER